MRNLSSQRLLSMNNNSKQSIDSNTWVIHIRSYFQEQELDEDQSNNIDDSTICVYSVPKSLRLVKPEAYSPQFIALGPYHHWRNDLYEMERYKLMCAKKKQKEFRSDLKFEDLVTKLSRKEYQIRGCYHKYLDMNGEALSWMMAIDGLFLLEFLTIYANCNSSLSNKDSLASSARMSYLVNAMGKKLAYNAILKDILMLENQIPIFVLKKILRIQCSSRDSADSMLHPTMMGVCKELSPLYLNQDYPCSEVVQCAHLLDLLYHLIVPKLEQVNEAEVEEITDSNEGGGEQPLGDDQNNRIVTDTWKLASKLTIMMKFTKFLQLKPMRLLAKLPIKVILKLPIVSVLAPALENMFLGSDDNGEENKSEKGSLGKDAQVPLVEEIMIPTVENLCKAGIQFWPTNGDITTVNFDTKAKRFYLPVLHLDGNTEVIMRNLVAYEASSVSGPLVLARYTELLNGIIGTPKDVEILRRSKIIISRLKSDNKVCEMWNGMTKAIMLSKVDFIDKAIESANTYHNNTSKIKCHRLMKAYIYGSWRLLIIFATILLLGLMTLQSFCTVYSCPRFFNLPDNTGTTPPDQ